MGQQCRPQTPPWRPFERVPSEPPVRCPRCKCSSYSTGWVWIEAESDFTPLWCQSCGELVAVL